MFLISSLATLIIVRESKESIKIAYYAARAHVTIGWRVLMQSTINALKKANFFLVAANANPKTYQPCKFDTSIKW